MVDGQRKKKATKTWWRAKKEDEGHLVEGNSALITLYNIAVFSNNSYLINFCIHIHMVHTDEHIHAGTYNRYICMVWKPISNAFAFSQLLLHVCDLLPGAVSVPIQAGHGLPAAK